MTPDELRSAVVVTDGRLDVPLAALTGISGFFTAFFTGGRIVLTAVTARTETADGVTVIGTGASGPFTGMAVTARFAIVDNAVTAVFKAAGDQDWTFVKAFPPLQYSIFETLRFQGPALTLDSTADVMTFTGTLIITTPMAPLDLLMPGMTHAITGEITTVTGGPELGFPTSTVPSILLYGPEGASIDLGLLRLTELRYEILGDPVFNYDIVDYGVQGSIVVTGSVPIRIAGQARSVLIFTEIFGWGDSLLFVADFTELGSLSFADVIGFTGQSALPVPFDVSVTSPVILTEVRMLVTPARMTVNYLSVKLETQEEWTIVEDLLVLQAIDLTFRIDNPVSSPQLSGSLSGLFGIGEAGTLEMTADFGDPAIGAALREDDGPLSIREVYTHFTDVDPAPVPDLSVARFQFGLTFPQANRAATYLGFLELTGDWVLSDQVSLTDVMFSLDHDTETRFAAMATFTIEGLTIGISASYDPAPDKLWEFTGETGKGQQIAIGALFQTLASHFGAIALPAPIAQLVIENLGVAVSTGSKRLYLTAEALFPIDTAQADLTLAIDTAARSFTGHLVVTVPTGRGPFAVTFDVQFSQQQTATLFTAAYFHARGDPVPQVRDLVAALLPTVAAYVPDGLVVDLRDAFMAVDGATYLFGTDLAVTIDLSHLPVFGEHLNLGEMGFDPLRLVALSAALTAAETTAVNLLLPSQVGRLPEQDLPAGFLVSGLLKLGAFEQPVVLPLSEQAPPPTQAPSKDTQTGDNALWYKVQRTFGPVHIERVGLGYLHVPGRSAELAVLVDASITVAGLTLSLDGLQAALSISDPRAVPSFDLAGLGLSYAATEVEITGSFLKSQVAYQGVTYPAYGGQAMIRAEGFALGAIGSYMQLPQGPSLFVYAFLDYPIGGPAFFFVRGLAAGFGYNRRLIPPGVGELASFPLVADALGGQPPSTLAGQLQRLQTSLPPSPGDFFLMAGVHFTSFEMIDSFLLLAVGFGHRFEMNLLGLSTLVLPAADAEAAGVTPIAEVQLALRATFVPSDGVFSISAQLTPNSYLLSRDCHLSGGFAFATWFAGEHNGDFVLTVGGYHPHFTPPAHYPAVPRLGFTWQVTPQLQVNGSAYYALTPSALMAGASLSATWQDDSLRAWFDTSMHFLIAWQPYHYEAGLHISVGASYTFSFFGTHTITVHVGADVSFWGPEFGGRAFIDLSVISFTITFGSGDSAKPQPIPWSRFKATLLPAAEKITTISVRSGTITAGTGTDLGVVDPHHLVLTTDSVIPSSAARRGPATAETALPMGANTTEFGVSPVGLRSVSATHRIEITSGGRRMDHLFSYEPVGKKLPYALWGGELETSLDHPRLVGDLVTGYAIRPLPPTEPAHSPSLPSAALQALTPVFTGQDAFSWANPQPYARSDAGDQARAAAITTGLTAPGVTAIRSALLDAVLKGADVDLAGFTAGQFLEIPQVAADG